MCKSVVLELLVSLVLDCNDKACYIGWNSCRYV